MLDNWEHTKDIDKEQVRMDYIILLARISTLEEKINNAKAALKD